MDQSRLDKITNYLFDHGETPVQTLAQAIGTSLATARRDLSELEDHGLVERLRGRARIASAAMTEAAFAQRETKDLSAKRAIARAGFAFVVPNSVIFLDAGTTVLQLARHLLLAQTPLTVVTNGLVVARELAHAPHIELIMLGGRLRAENMSTTGPGANLMIDTLWFDHLFLGASAISDDGWLSSFDADEAALNQRMIARSEAVTVLADHSKLSRRAAYSVVQLGAPHRLITNSPLPAALEAAAQHSGLEIVVAPHG